MKDETAWNEWLATLPESVQALCRKLPPNLLYRLKSSGRKVTLYSYQDDGTVTVTITREHNPAVLCDRQPKPPRTDSGNS